jgi:hypothetical protein
MKKMTVFAAINSSEHPGKIVPGLYRSTESGENWRRMTNFAPSPPPQAGGATDIVLDPIMRDSYYIIVFVMGYSLCWELQC